MRMLVGERAVAAMLSGAAGAVGAGGGGGGGVVIVPGRTETSPIEKVPARARKTTPCSPGASVPSGITGESPPAGTSTVPTDLPSTRTSTRPPLLAVPVSRIEYV